MFCFGSSGSSRIRRESLALPIRKTGGALSRFTIDSRVCYVALANLSNANYMELAGKVIKLLPEVSGQGKNGTWRKREFVLETDGQYPKKVCIAQWGDRIDQNAVQEGQKVVASIDVESREYNNRWYTEVKAWKVSPAADGGSEGGFDIPPPAESDFDTHSQDPTDDLPF